MECKTQNNTEMDKEKNIRNKKKRKGTHRRAYIQDKNKNNLTYMMKVEWLLYCNTSSLLNN